MRQLWSFAPETNLDQNRKVQTLNRKLLPKIQISHGLGPDQFSMEVIKILPTSFVRWLQSQSKLLPTLLTIGVMAIAFVVYLPTLAPTISWRNGGTDSGELAAAVATLGIPHPPGYPTYVLLGRLWIILPWGGDLAYRLNLLSASGAAVAAGLSTLTAYLLGRRLALTKVPLVVGAVLSGLFLAFAPLTWSQATIAEVYAPGLAMFSLFTLFLFWGKSQGSPWKLFLAGLIGGIGIGILPQLALAILCALGWLYFNHRQTSQRNPGPWLWPFLLGVGLGLSTFAYLPLRASVHPLFNWGDPSSPTRFWDVVTAAQYRRFVGTPSATEWFRRLFISLNRLGQDLSWAGFGLALLGIYALWKYKRRELGYLLSLGGLTLIFQTNYYAVINNWVYLLPVLYSLTLLAGIGITWLLTKAAKNIGLTGATFLGVGLILALGWRAVNLTPLLNASSDQSAALLGQRILSNLPPHALVVSERDETTFSLWYHQALGERSDIVVIDNRLLGYDWYQRNLLHHYPDLTSTGLKSGKFTVNRPRYILTGIPGEEEIQLQALE